MTLAIKREMRHRAAVEPVIGDLKNEHRMDRSSRADLKMAFFTDNWVIGATAQIVQSEL